MNPFIALGCLATMMLYAVPGFLLIKGKLVKEDHIPSFVRLLMFVCQPMLMIYSFLRVEYTPQTFQRMCVAFAIFFLSQLFTLGVHYYLTRKKQQDVAFRIYSAASSMGNCSFLGVPVLEAVLPHFPEALAYSAMASVSINVLGWTAISTVISRDTKYIRPKKILLNPVVLALFVALPLFFTQTTLPTVLENVVVSLGKMASPLCMVIIGMRLATTSLKSVFLRWQNYVAVGVKQILFPLLVYAVVFLLPLKQELRQAAVIIASCPVATLVLSFAEMLGEGQKTAAGIVLLGTTCAAITMPLITMLL